MKWMIAGVGTVFAMIILLAVVETGCIIGANLKAPEENATAVVLGCRVYGERASLSLIERLDAAYEPNTMLLMYCAVRFILPIAALPIATQSSA